MTPRSLGDATGVMVLPRKDSSTRRSFVLSGLIERTVSRLKYIAFKRLLLQIGRKNHQKRQNQKK